MHPKHACQFELLIQLVLPLKRVGLLSPHLRPLPVVVMRLNVGVEVILVLNDNEKVCQTPIRPVSRIGNYFRMSVVTQTVSLL